MDLILAVQRGHVLGANSDLFALWNSWNGRTLIFTRRYQRIEWLTLDRRAEDRPGKAKNHIKTNFTVDSAGKKPQTSRPQAVFKKSKLLLVLEVWNYTCMWENWQKKGIVQITIHKKKMGEGKLHYLYSTFRGLETLRTLPNKLNPRFQPTVLNEQHSIPLSLLMFLETKLSLMYHQETQKLVGFFHMEIDRSAVSHLLSSKTEGKRLKSLS